MIYSNQKMPKRQLFSISQLKIATNFICSGPFTNFWIVLSEAYGFLFYNLQGYWASGERQF